VGEKWEEGIGERDEENGGEETVDVRMKCELAMVAV
jgi:hypothetical protein